MPGVSNELHAPSTAFIVVDAIHGFFHSEGDHHHPAFDHVETQIRRLAGSCRDAGATLVHAWERHRPGPDFEFRRNGVHFLDGSWEATPMAWLAPLQPVPVAKRRFSAFFATDLDLLLRERGVRTVVLAGVKTNLCVRATATDAFSLGYDVVVVGDAVASNREHLHAAALEDVARYIGTVASTDDVLSALGQPTPTAEAAVPRTCAPSSAVEVS